MNTSTRDQLLSPKTVQNFQASLTALHEAARTKAMTAQTAADLLAENERLVAEKRAELDALEKETPTLRATAATTKTDSEEADKEHADMLAIYGVVREYFEPAPNPLGQPATGSTQAPTQAMAALTAAGRQS